MLTFPEPASRRAIWGPKEAHRNYDRIDGSSPVSSPNTHSIGWRQASSSNGGVGISISGAPVLFQEPARPDRVFSPAGMKFLPKNINLAQAPPPQAGLSFLHSGVGIDKVSPMRFTPQVSSRIIQTTPARVPCSSQLQTLAPEAGMIL